jgi:hypothetical protein
VRFLPEIALVVNTIRPSSLPAHVTPFSVWFGREPHFLRARPLNSENQPCDANGDALVFANGVDTGASDGGYSDDVEEANTNAELDEFILTALEQRIRKNNILVAARMVKKTAKKVQIFKEGWIVTLAIPAKLRRSAEPKRLPVRILNINKTSHTLICRFGRIKGAFQPGQLNTVVSATLGTDIPHAWPENAPKIVLTQAVQFFNGRGTIASVQKSGRDIEADQLKADKAVVDALETVAKWVAKLPAPVSPPRPASVSPVLAVEALPAQQTVRRGTKRRITQVHAEDILQAQILGETAPVVAALGRGKRVRISRRK